MVDQVSEYLDALVAFKGQVQSELWVALATWSGTDEIYEFLLSVIEEEERRIFT